MKATNSNPDSEKILRPDDEPGIPTFPTSSSDIEQASELSSLESHQLTKDWWSCRRIGPVSGRYEGAMTSPKTGNFSLDLRVDVDPHYPNSPVTNKVSGDIYQVNYFHYPFSWRVYKESWILDSPTLKWFRCQVEITGRVRYWKGIHLVTNVRIVIPWGTFRQAGPAEVTFIVLGENTATFTCERKSRHFRDVKLEVDVCNSVNTEPVLPSYDTCTHSNRPSDLPCRTLTIEEAYREAGVDLTINPTRTAVDDSAPEFSTWNDDELHDAMETHFSQYPGTWPKWHLWCLLAGRYNVPDVLGIMFDYGTVYGGPGILPERQGCAVFRDHSSLNDLVVGLPANDAQAAAMRDFLKLYVHEMGHVFNFVHSWNKGRPDSLSWMNYDWRYDDRNGANSFWANFRFEFDIEELIHLRHGDRSSVIPGGDPWASGSHMIAPPGAEAVLDGETPIELLLRSKPYFQFMEPVIIEFRLRNTSDVALKLDTRLQPEYGGVAIYIQRPDGRVIEYAPIMCKMATPEYIVLKPKHNAVQGEDRYSENVFLGFGTYGHYFNEPGEYLVRAIYQGAGNVLIPSNLLRVYVGRPFSRDEENIAQDYYTYEVGMSIYLNGSSSPFLKRGMDNIETIAERYRESPLGAHMSLLLAKNLARPFFRIEKGKLRKSRAVNTNEALTMTDKAIEQNERDSTTFTNITYHQLRRTRADLLVASGKNAEAKKELNILTKDLRKRGVNQPILDEIDAYARSI